MRFIATKKDKYASSIVKTLEKPRENRALKCHTERSAEHGVEVSLKQKIL